MKNFLLFLVTILFISSCGSDSKKVESTSDVTSPKEAAPAATPSPSPSPGVPLNLAWDAPVEGPGSTPVEYYALWQQIDNNAFKQVLQTTETTATVYIKPGIVYHYYVTSVNASVGPTPMESVPSNTIAYVLMPKLTIDATGTITSSVAPGKTYVLEATTDFKTWIDVQSVVATTDTITFNVPLTAAMTFFRLRALPMPPDETVARNNAAVLKDKIADRIHKDPTPVVETPPLPPVPPTRVPAEVPPVIEAPVLVPELVAEPEVKTFKQKVKDALKYKPGRHADPSDRFKR